MQMKIVPVLLALCACAALADVSHLAAGKVKLLHHLHKRSHHHHKRGIFHGVPTYKLGYDIPIVHHSVIKPLLVTYPTRPVPIGVKIPLKNPYEVKYPLPVGHAVPVPHPHFGLKFPGWHKPLLISGRPLKGHGHHEHHIHHHHVSVKPVIPIVPVPSPAVPIPAPTFPIPAPVVPIPPPVHVVPASPPTIIRPLPPPVHLHPVPPVHSTLVPFAPQPVLRPTFVPQPVVPIAHAPPIYHIRPGHAVQSSVFATFPRFPLVYQPQPVIPQGPHYHLVPQPIPQHPTPVVPVQPTGSASGFLPGVVQPTHPEIFFQQPPVTDSWNPIATNPTFSASAPQTPTQINPDHGYPPPTPHFTDGQTQVYENGNYHQLNEHQLQQFEEHQHQLHQQQLEQNQLHQQQLEHQQIHQQQLEQHQINQQHLEQQQHQQQLEQQQSHQHQLEQHQYQHHQFEQHQHDQFQQQLEQEQQLNQQYGTPQEQYGVPQQQQQLHSEYGAPQHQERYDSEGRNYQEDNTREEDSEQRYHNHIPLGLQLPLERRLEDFN